jgi:hypothetical protein
MLKLLAGATIDHYHGKNEPVSPRPMATTIQQNWAKVFESGKHELVEVWAEGKSITVLKLLLSGASKVRLILVHVSLSVFQVYNCKWGMTQKKSKNTSGSN